MPYSYETYLNWSTSFPLAVVGIFLGLNFLVFPATYVLLRTRETISKHLINFFYIVSKIVFRDALKKKERKEKKEDDEEDDEEDTFLLHGYEIPSGHMLILMSTVSTITLCSVFISFWASFLIDQTAVCDPMLDCFLGNSSSSESDPSSFEPIQDCTDVESNATVECYEFVFAVSEGFASAIGFLAVVVAYIYIIGYLLIWLIEAAVDPSDEHICARKLARVGWLCLLILPSIFALIVFIIIGSVPLFSDVAFATRESSLKFIAYWLCFTYVGPFAIFYISFTLLLGILYKKVEESN
jgi:hypothetical protein